MAIQAPAQLSSEDARKVTFHLPLAVLKQLKIVAIEEGIPQKLILRQLVEEFLRQRGKL